MTLLLQIQAAYIVGGCFGQVLIASGLPSDSSHLNGTTVEAPLIINIPNGQSCKTYENSQPTASAKGMNITVPVSVQKQILPATTTSAAAKVEGVDSIRPASNSMAPRKKRKKWSEEEDLELISAVEKYGVGNWTTILKGDFKGDRTANQLSQVFSVSPTDSLLFICCLLCFEILPSI